MRKLGKRGDETPTRLSTALIMAFSIIAIVVVAMFLGNKYLKKEASNFYKGVNVDLVKQACQTDCSIGSYYSFCNVKRTVTYEDKDGNQKSFDATCIDIANRRGAASVIPKTKDIEFPSCDEAKCSSVTTEVPTFAEAQASCNSICVSADAYVTQVNNDDTKTPQQKTDLINTKKNEACCNKITYKNNAGDAVTAACSSPNTAVSSCSSSSSPIAGFCAGVTCTA